MLDQQEFSLALKETRGNRSLREIESETKISFSTFNRLENGGTPSLENYIRLCKWLGRDLDYFIIQE